MVLCDICIGWSKFRLTVVSTQNTECILLLLFVNYCIIFHMNNCKSTFAHSGGLSANDKIYSREESVKFGAKGIEILCRMAKKPPDDVVLLCGFNGVRVNYEAL